MASDDSGPTTPDQQIRQLYERAERDAAQAAERLVGGKGFGQSLALLTENVMALTRVGNDGLDLALRNLRLAGRRDLTHLAKQINRTEDKLERVLQEVEALRDEVAALHADQREAAPGTDRGSSSSSSSSSNGARRTAARRSAGSTKRSGTRGGGAAKSTNGSGSRSGAARATSASAAG